MLQTDIAISIYEAVGSHLCVSSSDGQKVYGMLATVLKENRNILLSFDNVTILTSAFLHAAVGQLYGQFSEEKIRSSLKVVDMSSDDLVLLKYVVDTAKQYFKDPQQFNQAVQEVMGDEEDYER